MYAESRTCPGVAGASWGGASSGPIRAVAAVGSCPLPGAVAVATGASGTERRLGHAEGAACPAAASSRVHSRAPALPQGRTSGLGRCRGERTGHLDARASWRPNTRRVHTCTYAPTGTHTYARTHVHTCMQRTPTRTPSLSDQAGVSPAVCHGFFSFPSLSEWGCPRGSRPQALAPVCPPPRSPHLPPQNGRPMLRPRRASRHQLPAGGELSHHTARLWCWPLPWPGLTLHPSVPVTVGFWVPQRAWEPWFRLHPARPRGGQLPWCS